MQIDFNFNNVISYGVSVTAWQCFFLHWATGVTLMLILLLQLTIEEVKVATSSNKVAFDLVAIEK